MSSREPPNGPIVAICWELGGGFGHLSLIAPIVNGLLERDYAVHLISRDLGAAVRFFGDRQLTYYQAPFQHSQTSQFRVTPTYSHILHNVGYGDSEILRALTIGWRSLFARIQPDFVIAEHAPTALLAARTMKIKSIACGSGFVVPPAMTPLPRLLRGPEQGGRVVEETVRDNVNSVLSAWGQTEIKGIADLYGGDVHRLLLTFPELDHFPQRFGEKHFGIWPFRDGESVTWPAGKYKVFAYLKAFASLPGILNEIRETQYPAHVVVSDVPPETRKKFENSKLSISSKMVDLRLVDCDELVAVTNGTLGMLTALLLRGIPVVSVPLYLEQLILARLVEKLGAGLIVLPESVSQLGNAIRRVATDDRFRFAAQKFAAKYRDFDPDKCNAEIIQTVTEIARTASLR